MDEEAKEWFGWFFSVTSTRLLCENIAQYVDICHIPTSHQTPELSKSCFTLYRVQIDSFYQEKGA